MHHKIIEYTSQLDTEHIKLQKIAHTLQYFEYTSQNIAHLKIYNIYHKILG